MIHSRSLTKTLQAEDSPVSILNGIDVDIERGCFFVLLGPSGSGKTTLLRMIAGLDYPDEGEIIIDDQIVFSKRRRVAVPPELRQLGMVFQSYAIWPHLSVFDNVALPLRSGVQRIAARLVDQRVRRALASVRLEHLADRPAPLLSGGQQQRVALARALAVQPKALLMDEPLSNLDARLREDMRSMIRSVVRESGVTVLYVTHDRAEAMALADRVAVMDAGKIVQIGSPAILYADPATLRVAELFGSMNWIHGRVDQTDIVETGLGRLRATTRGLSGAIIAGIRPEHIVLRPDHMPDNTVNGCVVESTFYGDHHLCAVQTGEARITVKLTEWLESAAVGRRVGLLLPAEKVHVFPLSDG